MKKFKFAKIFVLVLSVALLIGSAIGVATSANETESYEIEAINVIYKDQIFVAIAVDAPVEEAANIEVGYTFNGTSYTADYHSNMAVWEKNGDDTLYPVFVTVGIPAKDQGEDIIAEAHVKGGAAGNAKNVSVASYLYQRLYKDGVIAATDEDGLAYREFYLSTLRYIAKAQTVLYNNENPDLAPRTLVTDYVAVMMEDATVGDSSFKFMKESGEVTLTYTGAETKIGWNITTYDEWGVATTKSTSSDTIALDKPAVITPLVLDFAINAPTMIETFDNGYTDNIVTLNNGQKVNCPSFGSYITTAFPLTKANGTGESVARVVEYTISGDETSNALNMFSPGRIDSDGKGNDDNRSHSMNIKPMETLVPEDKVNATVFEFDIMCNFVIPEEGSCAVAVDYSPFQITAGNNNENGAPSYQYVQYNPSVDKETFILTMGGIEVGRIDRFINLKLVYDIKDELIHVYANGELKGSIAESESGSGTHTNAYWDLFSEYGLQWITINTMNDNGMVDVYIDNVRSYNTYCID